MGDFLPQAPLIPKTDGTIIRPVRGGASLDPDHLRRTINQSVEILMRVEILMPCGFIPLIASIALTGVDVFVTGASFWSQAWVAGLLVVSWVWRYGVFLQVALGVFLLL